MKLWISFFAFLLVLDAASKVYAAQMIPPLGYGPYPFGGIEIFQLGKMSCSLNMVTNTGAAWGVFSGYAGILFALRTIVIVAIVFFVPKRPAIFLALTGAVGNAVDYCLYGHVIDFIHFHFWDYSFPIFNIADACISVGILSLLLLPRPKKVPAL